MSMCVQYAKPSIITDSGMWQFWLKVVLQYKYGESSRPPFFTYTLADDEESLRLKFDLDTETQFSYLFGIASFVDRNCSHCFRVSSKYLIIDS